jgi:hypothetical protein
LVGPGAAVAGAATRQVSHGSSGALIGPGATVAGAATSTAPPKNTTGALIGPDATVAGVAVRFRNFNASGTLVGPGATLVGAASLTGSGGGFPNPSVVFAGVQYGPGGIYVGTFAGGPTETRHSLRSFSSGVLIGPGVPLLDAANLAGDYPDPSVVLAGVQYGPSNIYVGTLTDGPSETRISLRSFTGSS